MMKQTEGREMLNSWPETFEEFAKQSLDAENVALYEGLPEAEKCDFRRMYVLVRNLSLTEAVALVLIANTLAPLLHSVATVAAVLERLAKEFSPEELVSLAKTIGMVRK